MNATEQSSEQTNEPTKEMDTERISDQTAQEQPKDMDLNSESAPTQDEEEVPVDLDSKHYSKQDEEEDASKQNEEEEDIPEAKFKTFDKVFARDNDGLMYEAVIRRSLFGPSYQQQVQVGMASSAEEVENMVQQSFGENSWHYFVHFNGWNVRFDRWIAACGIKDINDETKAYADLLLQEHKILRKSMTRKQSGKNFVRAVEFLREWRKKIDVINLQHRVGEAKETASPKRPSKRSDEWTKVAVQKELQVRRKGLTKKRTPDEASTIVLPFTLKKVLVEQWEIMSQCQMVSRVPATTSVRQALNHYLESKGVTTDPLNAKATPKGSESSATSNKEPEPDKGEIATDPTPPVDASIKSSLSPDNQVETENIDTTSSQEEKNSMPTLLKRASTNSTLSSDEANPEHNDLKSSRDQEWIDMADGIALLFDEALPSRLLYEEERPQLRVLDSSPEFSELRYSELYGCEHLLRLFVRLPPLLADAMPEEEARRPIIAKVNDLVRFIHKNQGTLLTQTYRKLNELERETPKSSKARKRKNEQLKLPTEQPAKMGNEFDDQETQRLMKGFEARKRKK
jgi:hypothetical protein